MRKTTFESFMSKVEKTDTCWNWKGHKDRKGYGQTKLSGKRFGAHRLSYLFHLQDPGKNHVLHKCDNPKCVNPDHLFLGTHQDNMSDMSIKGRSPNQKIKPNDVITIRKAIKDGFKQSHIAFYFDVHSSSIKRVNRLTHGTASN